MGCWNANTAFWRALLGPTKRTGWSDYQQFYSGCESRRKTMLRSLQQRSCSAPTWEFPGEFYERASEISNTSVYVQRLQESIAKIAPILANSKSKQTIFVHPDLKTCKFIFVCVDKTRSGYHYSPHTKAPTSCWSQHLNILYQKASEEQKHFDRPA